MVMHDHLEGLAIVDETEEHLTLYYSAKALVLTVRSNNIFFVAQPCSPPTRRRMQVVHKDPLLRWKWSGPLVECKQSDKCTSFHPAVTLSLPSDITKQI